MSNDNGIFGNSQALGELVTFPKILKSTKVTFPKILKPAAPAAPKSLDLSALFNRNKQTVDLTGAMARAIPADATAPAAESADAGSGNSLLMYAAIGGVVLVGAYLLLGRK